MINERDLDQASALTQRLLGAIGETIVGQAAVVESTLIALLCGGHLLLEGVPGLGKTLLVRALASALGLRFSRIQFTPDLMPADILGTNVLSEDGGQRRFTYSPGPIFGNVILADEVNRATPKTQSALLEAMEEQTVTVGKATYPLDSPFIVLATQNPIEMEGTYPLPEAQVDRFLFKVGVGFPSVEELVAITERNTEHVGHWLPKPVATAEDVLSAQSVAREIPIARPLREYIARLVFATHPEHGQAPKDIRSFVEYGASPRAAIALILGAKAHALLAGEPNVRRADIEAVFRPALVHRVILNFKGEAEGVSVSSLLDQVWEETPIL
ncbi:MAG: AAA family ATPase [Candidatus Bipolaricaulis sp.]|nr:AAA family ATPase [Candidatus Bipolaricaulis sp.]MDD5219634.1 AAA family ATPase [Candidatus Bipolaricaulis sp.]MDD5645734.1 AAA family ATPase [Candidatus Bipolaricaulis sp.]